MITICVKRGPNIPDNGGEGIPSFDECIRMGSEVCVEGKTGTNFGVVGSHV